MLDFLNDSISHKYHIRVKFQCKIFEEQKLNFDMMVSCKKGYKSLS